MESPSCYETLQVLEALHLRAVEVPHVPQQGIDLVLLEAAVSRHPVAAVLTIATCHNPLGDCVSDAPKARIVAFAERRDIPLIESDTFGDLVFAGPRPRALKAFDTTGIVMQCCSLAHYVAPGFNLGWANAGRWQAKVQHLKSITNVANALLPQLAHGRVPRVGRIRHPPANLRVALWRAVESARDEVMRTFPPAHA